jgi:hypothetical protein
VVREPHDGTFAERLVDLSQSVLQNPVGIATRFLAIATPFFSQCSVNPGQIPW